MFFERFSPFLLTFAFQEFIPFTPPLTLKAIQPTITNLFYDQPLVFGKKKQFGVLQRLFLLGQTFDLFVGSRDTLSRVLITMPCKGVGGYPL
jgi:hypothetical protein